MCTQFSVFFFSYLTIIILFPLLEFMQKYFRLTLKERFDNEEEGALKEAGIRFLEDMQKVTVHVYMYIQRYNSLGINNNNNRRKGFFSL